MGKIVDLSLLLEESLPGTWPGQKPYSHVLWKDFAEGEPYSTYHFTMDEHCGTHCDAPAHFIRVTDEVESNLFGDALDLSRMQGPLAVMDVRYLNEEALDGVSPWIEVSDIRRWESGNRTLVKGDILVFRTGWDRYYVSDENRYRYGDGPVRDHATPGWPTPSIEALTYLHEKGIDCLGIDASSMGAVHDGVPPHQWGLGQRMIFIEGLGHLNEVPKTGAQFIFLPLKIARSTGCPGRAIAILP